MRSPRRPAGRQRERLTGDLIIELDKRKKQVGGVASGPRSARGGPHRPGRAAIALGVTVTGAGVVVGSVELAQAGIAVVAVVSGCLVVARFRGRVSVSNFRTQPPMVAVGMPGTVDR